ncbi:MAG: thioredoxin family protein [Alphaproteobacteria bacterium]|nr:thioredoxin family protein [Alphaproteobacteria bacterium]
MGFLSSLFQRAPQVLPDAVLTAAELDAVVAEGQPTIVDVWSPTCGPCKALAPVVIDVTTRYQGRVRVVQIDSSRAEPALMQRLQVRSVPTLLIYRDGELIGRHTGWRPKSWFDEMVDVEFGEE